LPSAALVRRLLALVDETDFEGAAARLAAFWREHAAQIRQMLARAEALGGSLRSRSFEYVLCYADIHAANVLVGSATPETATRATAVTANTRIALRTLVSLLVLDGRSNPARSATVA